MAACGSGDRAARGGLDTPLRESRANSSTDPHGRWQPSAVHQGGGGLAAAARLVARSCSCTRASTSTMRSQRCSSPSSGCPRRRSSSRSPAAPTPLRPPACSARSEPVIADAAPDCVLVYGDTNSTLGRRAGRRPAGRPGGARGGGHALLRPSDAGGDQPRAHRPSEHAAAVLVAGGSRQPRGGGNPRRGVRRRRDGGRRARGSAARAGAGRSGAGPRCRAGDLPAGHRPPRRQRRRSRAAGGAGRAAARHRRAGRAAAAPADPRAARGGRAARASGSAGAGAGDPAARLLRADGAALQRPSGADRLRRPAEGGVPGRRSLRDAAHRARNGSRRSSRAGTRWSTSTLEAARAALAGADARRAACSCTGTDSRRAGRRRASRPRSSN